MNLSSILVVFLLVAAGLVYVFQQKPESKETSKPKKTVVKKVAEDELPPLPVPSPALPEPAPEPVVAAPAPPAVWYTARRISSMSETGVSSVPAGREVTKVSETEVLYNGKSFTVKPGDLTSDMMVVADLLTKQDAAGALEQKERESAVAAMEQANNAAVKAHAEDKKAERRQQAAAAIESIDRQIVSLREKIKHERDAELVASINNRISSRGAVIAKCEQAIAKLEAERLRLSSLQ
ncbi:hypothetical protein DES53_102709 [Roseimicrobium gellanilyticum]|uniref:Uncharacterized protein n=1 Tax=Roseimicrobium gellanilyticum TaxID=748857 RepID=A0A366HRL3_9BACT|nr:hypothetical protein [Roseimicrobium gellanilyticum]RBP46321.1 hypothetical protein DES53_102709 [Roseimicrobium gellanilyticum]